MKSGNIIKHLLRIIILTLLIGVVAVSTSFTVDSQDKIKEHRTEKVLLVIDEKLNEFVSADESDRTQKINVFMELAEFQPHIYDSNIHGERIDSEVNVILNRIIDWFYYNYMSMVFEIAEEAAEDISEVQQYLYEITADIDTISEYLSGEHFDPDDTDTFDERLYRAELFAKLSNMYEEFLEEDFIPHRLDANGDRIHELTEVLSLIETESVIDGERIVGLNNMINSLVEEFTDTDQIAVIETGNIVQRFEIELSLQRLWFEEHYTLLIYEILNMDREDEYDEDTVKNQIEELKLVMQFIEDDGIISYEFLISINELIEQLIEEYEIELAAIEERIKQREIAAAKAAEAAAAAAARRRNTATTSSTTGNRTGSTNNNTSNTSSNSNSTSARVNNNYPSITSNCREMLARLVRLEAPNEGADGKQAVAEVVLNRMVSSRWSHANTVEEVIFDDKWGVQFTVKDRIWTDRGTPSSSDYAAVDRALSGSNILGRAYVFFNTRPVTQNDVIWIGVHAFSK